MRNAITRSGTGCRRYARIWRSVPEAGRGPRIETFVLSLHRRGDQILPLEEAKVVIRQGDREIQGPRQLPQMEPGIPADEIVEVLAGRHRQDVLVLGHALLNAGA